MKMYYCEVCGNVKVLSEKQIQNLEGLKCHNVDEFDGLELLCCRGKLKPCTEFVTSKDIIDHVSQLQVSNSMLRSSNESLTTEKNAFNDAYCAAQKTIKELEKTVDELQKRVRSF